MKKKMKRKGSFKKAVLTAAIACATITAAGILYGGAGNKFEFDKNVYNLAVQNTTEIKVTEDKGYRFSGTSKKISGNSKINGKTVTLQLSSAKEDTQVSGFFVPTGDVPSEKEMWVNSQKVTVIEHYIEYAVYRQYKSRIAYTASVVAKPLSLPTPHITVQPPTFTTPRPMTVFAFDGKFQAYKSIPGVHNGGVITSTFFGDKAQAGAVPATK